MIQINYPRIFAVVMSSISFVLLLLIEGLKKEFNSVTIIVSIFGAVIVFVISSFLKVAEFDSNSLKFLIGPKKYLQKGLIALGGISKIAWQDKQSVTLERVENGQVEQFNIVSDRSKIEMLIAFIKEKNRTVIIVEDDKSKFVSLNVPKPILQLFIICIIFFAVGMILVAKQRGWLN